MDINNNDTADTQMEMEMETDPATTEPSNVKGLLTLARQFVQQGQPSLALQAVVMAMKSNGGDEAVSQTLNRARELYRNKLRETAVADELASLFAECAIAEAQPLGSEASLSENGGPSVAVTPDAHGTSILAKTGRKQIMLDAFSDGSSFVCLQCGGLVSTNRKDEHLAYWCCKI